MACLLNSAAKMKKSDALFRSYSVAYYFSKIFGAMPFKIERNDMSTKSEKSKWCYIGVLFSLIYIGLVATSMMMTMKVSDLTKFRGTKFVRFSGLLYFPNFVDKNFVLLPIMSIHDRTQMIVAPMFLWSVVVSQVFVIASFILLPLQLGELNVVFQKFRRLMYSKEGLLLFGDGTKAEQMARNVRRSTWKIIIFYIFLAVSSAVSSFNRIRLSAGWTFLIMVDVVTKKMEALSLCIEFCALCDVLLHCFYSINENLLALKYRCRENKRQEPYPNLAEMLPPTRDTIKALSDSHSQLCDIIEQVNRIYQIQNLFGILVCTLKMLPHLFLTGIILTYSNFKILHSSFFLWPAQYIYRVFIVCNSATNVTNEATKAYTYVGSLYDEESINEDSKQEIILFMNRINNRSIQFSLCGLCKLDNECFVSNLVTVSGYFIIILQSYMTLIENLPTEISSEFEGHP